MKEDERRLAILQRLTRMENDAPRESAIPTGFAAFDAALGGGYPRSAMVEVFGPSGCGKTTLTLQTIAHIQESGLHAAWIDADHTFDAAYAASLGVDIERLPLAQPANAEEALEITRTLASSGAVDLIAIDSAAALAPRLEVEAGIGQSIPGLHSRVLGSELRKLSISIRRGSCCVVFLNQMRNRMDTPGEGETSAGGPPLKLFAAIRIGMLPAGGSRLRLRVLRNKAAEASAGRELEWRRGSGFVKSP